jgi:predicted exporter
LKARWAAILLWIVAVAACIAFSANLHINTDMAAFLPRTASPAQRVLVDHFREGLVSRLILVAIEGVPPDELVAIGRKLAAKLRSDSNFIVVENGEEAGFTRDSTFLWSHRYVLSDQVEPNRFTSTGLRSALERDLADLGSTAGFLIKRT